jgi:PAS domain S-box-containing protein
MGFPDDIFTHTLDAMLLAGDDAHLVEANPAACELTGYERDELLRLTVFDLAAEKERPTIHDQWQQFLAAGRAEGTFNVRRSDGTTREADFRAVAAVGPGLHLSVLRDVSEQRRAERAAAEREEWIDSILEQLPAALWIVDRRLRMTFVKGASHLPPDLLAEGPVPLEDVTTRPEAIEAHRQALGGAEAWFEHPFGSTVWHCHVEPLRRRGGEVVGVLGVALDVSETVRIRHELEDTLRTVRKLEGQRRNMARELRMTRDEERRRLARELHDDLGQAAALMAVLARTLERDVPDDFADRVGDLHDLAQRAAQSTRRLIGQLRDEPDDDLTLRASLGRLADEFAARHELDVEVSVSGGAGEVPVTVVAAAYRIARESVTNAVKHAGASVVSIVARATADRLTLVIEDDGVGFDRAATARPPRRHGLVGMQELAAEAGGVLTIDAAPGKGTVIRAELPLDGA